MEPTFAHPSRQGEQDCPQTRKAVSYEVASQNRILRDVFSHKLATYLSKWLASCGDGRIVPCRLLFIKKSATLEGEEMGLSLERMDVMLDDNEIDDEGRLLYGLPSS